MARLLSLFLLFHWAAVFTLLAALSVFGGESGADASFAFFGLVLPSWHLGPVAAPVVTGLSTAAFALCGLLFWWALMTDLGTSVTRSRDVDEILVIAFAGATALLTLIMIIGAFNGAGGLLPVMATHFAALISSYVALSTERTEPAKPVLTEQEELRRAARIHALDASQTALLPRFGERLRRLSPEAR